MPRIGNSLNSQQFVLCGNGLINAHLSAATEAQYRMPVLQSVLYNSVIQSAALPQSLERCSNAVDFVIKDLSFKPGGKQHFLT